MQTRLLTSFFTSGKGSVASEDATCMQRSKVFRHQFQMFGLCCRLSYFEILIVINLHISSLTSSEFSTNFFPITRGAKIISVVRNSGVKSSCGKRKEKLKKF